MTGSPLKSRRGCGPVFEIRTALPYTRAAFARRLDLRPPSLSRLEMPETVWRDLPRLDHERRYLLMKMVRTIPEAQSSEELEVWLGAQAQEFEARPLGQPVLESRGKFL